MCPGPKSTKVGKRIVTTTDWYCDGLACKQNGNFVTCKNNVELNGYTFMYTEEAKEEFRKLSR